MSTFNGKFLIHNDYKVINNQTITLTDYEVVPNYINQIVCEGNNVITLPPVQDDSTAIELIIKNGQTTITNDIDGNVNTVFNIPNQKISLIRHDSEYSIISIGQVDSVNVVNMGVKYFFDNLNSFQGTLNAGASNNGIIVDVTQYPSISLLSNSNKKLLIIVNQYIDSLGLSQACETKYFSTLASEPFGESFEINGNYIKVDVVNMDSSSANVHLDVAYGVIDNTLNNNGRSLISQAMTTGSQVVRVNDVKEGTCQVVSTATGGSFIFEVSNDGINYVAIPVQDIADPSTDITTAITASTTNKIYQFKCNTKFIQLRIVTTLTGGSITNYLQLK